MATQRVRRFTILDALVLIAGTGVGLACARASLTAMSYLFSLTAEAGQAMSVAVLGSWIVAFWPLPAAWTLTVLLLQLRPPRPRLRRLARRPGFVACVAALSGILLGACSGLYGWLYLALRYDLGETGGAFFTAAWPPGYTVATAWLCLALSTRWRRPADWLDWLGRLLGVYWLATMVLNALALFNW